VRSWVLRPEMGFVMHEDMHLKEVKTLADLEDFSKP
jgi:hypothetical protein